MDRIDVVNVFSFLYSPSRNSELYVNPLYPHFSLPLPIYPSSSPLISISSTSHSPQELEGEWAWQQGEEAMLRSQLKRLQDNLRRTERHAEKGQREKAILEEKIGEGDQWAQL